MVAAHFPWTGLSVTHHLQWMGLSVHLAAHFHRSECSVVADGSECSPSGCGWSRDFFSGRV